MKRRATAILCALLMLAALASCDEALEPIISVSGTAVVSTEDDYIEYGDSVPDEYQKDGKTSEYEYRLYGRHVEITKYTGPQVDVVIPAGIENKKVTVIGQGAFADRASLISVAIPDTVETVEKYAFYRCYNLEKVTGGENVVSIGEGAFEFDGRLKSADLGGSLKSIGDRAFMWCTSLESVTIPAGCDVIGSRAFGCCTGVTELVFEDGSLESVGDEAFLKLSSVKSVCWPAVSVSAGTGIFMQASSLTDITFASDASSVSAYAFNGCPSLQSVVIPDHIGTVGDFAFGSCRSLTECTIESSFTVFSGRHIFHQVEQLTIRGKKGSTAEFYASMNGYGFELISAE